LPTSHPDILDVTTDVSRSADVDEAVSRVESELGPIDILVCSAGVPGASLATVDVSDEEWNRMPTGSSSATGPCCPE
jgi:NAD(P)-dependent dehydrogenase (short-subunit alcohol dehydrogenase family)